MFAIVETGGKQYRISPNERFVVENLNSEVGSKIALDKVLFVKNEQGEVKFGSPVISGAKVEIEVLRNFKDKKVIVFKKRRRQNSRRKNGHRQQKTEVKVLSINA